MLAATVVVVGINQGKDFHLSGEQTTLVGRPTWVTDGDTIRMQDVPVRLHGIDAPELDTPDGVSARTHLRMLIAGRPIACADTGQRSYGRVVAICRTDDGVDLAQAMVEDGWAVDWPRHSKGRYAAAQVRAQMTRRGVHRR